MYVYANALVRSSAPVTFATWHLPLELVIFDFLHTLKKWIQTHKLFSTQLLKFLKLFSRRYFFYWISWIMAKRGEALSEIADLFPPPQLRSIIFRSLKEWKYCENIFHFRTHISGIIRVERNFNYPESLKFPSVYHGNIFHSFRGIS